jgi:hypothetical protein
VIRWPNSRVILAAFAVLVLGYVAVMPPYLPAWMVETIQSLRAGVALVIVIAYGAGLVAMLRRCIPEATDSLVIGIWATWLADLYGAIQSLAWRYAGRPDDWLTAWWWMMPAFLTFWGGLNHIAVPGALDGRVPRRNMVLLGTALALGGLLAGILIGSRAPWR